MYELKLGSHVGVTKAGGYLEGSIKQALSYNSNAMMIYTGAPQNTRRTDINEMKIPEMKSILKENNIPLENVIVHAPYIINLASPKPSTREIAISFLIKELKRTEEIGAKYIVLHPGNHTGCGVEQGTHNIVTGLDEVFEEYTGTVQIALETMAGKGTEIGRNFNEINDIITGSKNSDRIVVCMDTCHINDAGYDLSDFDQVLSEFDEIVGLGKLKVIHVNDSKNIMGAKKDRHENIGYGHIGFEKLLKVVFHPRTEKIVKILETP